MFAYFREANYVCKSINQLPRWFFHEVVSVIVTELCLCTCLRRPINGSTISSFCFSFYIPVSRFFLFQFFVFQFCVIHILCFISTLFLCLHHFYCCIIYLQSLSTQIYKPAIHFLPCSAVARSFTDALSKFPV